jgi:CRISPR-associated protein Csb3
VTDRVITGRLEAALSHFTLLGLAAIVDLGVGQASRVWWTDEQVPRPVLSTVVDDDHIANAVRQHAAIHAGRQSWVSMRAVTGARAGSGLFTARARVPALADWPDYAEERRRARKQATLDPLDGRLLAALGEPAWWRCDEKQSRADDGASRWEMKTRNQGQEFLLHRLSPLAEAVAKRSAEDVMAGLRGERILDETGKNSPASRTATGLATPAPVDSAVAWCALWGLHVAPTVHQKTAISQTPGVWPRRQVHPRHAALPVYTRPVSVRRFSQILASRHFDVAARHVGQEEGTAQDDVMPTLSSRRWLTEQGVRAVVRFPVLRTGSDSAPERQILTGEVHVL